MTPEDRAFEAGRSVEREAIVAYLRGHMVDRDVGPVLMALNVLCAEIEAEEHLRVETPQLQ